MALNNPTSGDRILPWAKEATRVINSLKPTSGRGVTITRTNSGTTIGIKESSIPHPDSSPTIIGGDTPNTTTYSLEKNAQNDFSLYRFSDISSTYNYSFEQLSGVDFIVRDLSTENSVLSSPTVRYWNFLKALSAWAGERGEDGGNGTNGQNALSVIPDSEIREPITYSIQHNTENVSELELYKFHDWDYTTEFYPSESDITHILVRKLGERVDSSGNVISCQYLEYATLSSVISAGVDNDYLFSAKLDEDGCIMVYFPSTVHVAYINGNEVHQDANSQIIDGWNFFNQSDNAVYLNFYCDANSQDAGNTYFAESGKWSWDLETVVGGQAGPNKVLMFSEMIAERVSDGEGGYILKQYRKGSVELGMPLGDADAQILGQALGNRGVSRSIQQYQVPGDSGNHMALQLYDWHDANYQRINQSDVMKVFTNIYPRSSIAFMFKDGHDQGTVNGELKYINGQELLSWTLPDNRIPNPISKSLNAGVIPGLDEEDIGATGVHLFNFFEGTNINYTRQNGVIVARQVTDYTYPTSDFDTVSSYSDIVIRVRGQNGNVPEVSYIPLSALPLSGGGGNGYPLDGEEGDIGYSIDLNSENETEIYGFEDVENHRADSINARRHDFILRYQNGNQTPEVQYAKLSAVESIISADLMGDGLTTSIEYVISSSYSTQTHKFINRIGQMTFTNGLLTGINNNFADREVFTAVEEEL